MQILPILIDYMPHILLAAFWQVANRQGLFSARITTPGVGRNGNVWLSPAMNKTAADPPDLRRRAGE